MDDTPTLNDRVASEIRAWMGRRQTTGRKVAEKMGKSQTWVSTRTRGETEIALNDLALFADALDIEVTALVPQPTKARDINDSYPPPVRTVTAGTRPDQPAELVTVGAPATRPTPCHASGRSSGTATAAMSAPRTRQSWR